ETARTWAYRELRHHFGDSHGFYNAVSWHVHELNAEFSEPLPANEAHQIATSIHKWITTQSRMWADGPAVYEATFSTIQAARGRNSGKARAANKRTAVFDLIEEGKRCPPNTDIHETAGVSANSQRKPVRHPEASLTGPLSQEMPIWVVLSDVVKRSRNSGNRDCRCVPSLTKLDVRSAPCTTRSTTRMTTRDHVRTMSKRPDFTIAQVVKQFAVSQSTLRRGITSGRFPNATKDHAGRW